MPKIENFAEHDFHFPKWKANPAKPEDGNVVMGTNLVIPRFGIRTYKEMKDGKEETSRRPGPGIVTVTDEQLAELKASPVAKSWFDRTADGQQQLIVVPDAPAQQTKKAA